MRKISADYVFPIDDDPIAEGVVILDDDGNLLALEERSRHDKASLEIYAGILVPGFVNTHCHLELSHMKGKVDTGTGLLPFLQQVVAFRDVDQEEIDAAIDQADRDMYEAGIVAVGDISNKLDTAARKAQSPIRYYTFVEMFDFLQDAWAERTFDQYAPVYAGQADGDGNRKSAVPHSPYTVSPALFERINALNPPGVTVSIHNQETYAENELFLSKTGGFLDFYKGFDISLDAFQPTSKTSIYYALLHLDPQQRTLFVHNTLTTAEDIRAAQAWSRAGVYWATCPNANLYIENRLPYYQHFLDTDAVVTIGTDSLTSNWQLSVLEELKTIARYQSYVPLATLLRWATLNGAEALGFADELGSLTPGKRPGVNLLTKLSGSDLSNLKLTPQSRVERLA